ncbi:MAG: hypothetical protein APR63_13290 [Desulfuromonas sp. SDB]|nr:MAG: hypothetical protein APR63_13290 [Desulfuromonas sp. SDB]
MPLEIILSTSVVGAVGLCFGIILSIAAKKFKVETDPRVDKILEVLPNANCGACGAPGCEGFAKGVVEGKYPCHGCIPGGQDVAEKVSKILGVKAETSVKQIAVLMCGGTRQLSPDIADYDGVNTCRSAHLILGGSKACVYGCIGFGDCVEACPFDAIHIGKQGLPQIDGQKCTGCGNCVQACPKNILKLYPVDTPLILACSNPEKLKEVKAVCKVGCIACSLCVKKAPPQALKMENNLPRLQPDAPKDIKLYEEAVNSCPSKCLKLGVD